MQESKGDQSPLLQKSRSYQQRRSMSKMESFTSLEYLSLSSSAELAEIKAFSPQDLLEYVEDVLGKIYQEDTICLRETWSVFLKAKKAKLMGKIKQRLSLLKYLEESLMFRSFSEISDEMGKQWKKNPLLYSLSTIWSKCVLTHQFKSKQQFLQQYDKYRTLITNLSLFYFNNSLRLLHNRQVDTFALILEDPSHKIINDLEDWELIYNKVLKRLLSGDDKKLQSLNSGWLDFDLTKLRINPEYLNLHALSNQLPKTTASIASLQEEHRIHQKISILRDIRTIFLDEITANNARIKSGRCKSPQFEKDDIIDCMIYCIVKGKLHQVGHSIQALMALLGKDNTLLARKGVDSYRADLQGACQYIEGQHQKNSCSTNHSDHE